MEERSGGIVRTTAIVLLATTNFLAVFDGLVVTVALPAIQQDLSLSGASGQWMLTAYTVPLGGLLLLGGRLGDRFGRRRVLVTGLGLFAAGLLLSGFGPAAPAVLIGRALQGAGAALAVPASFATISAFPSTSQRNRTFAAVAVAGGAGSASGALIGGLVTEGLGWRYVFLLTAPLAVVALLVAPAVLAESTRFSPRGSRMRLDLPAALLAVIGAGAAVFGVTWIERAGPLSAGTIGALMLAVLCMAMFIVRERHSHSPLLPLSLLSDRALLAALLATPGQVVAYDGTVFAALLYLQQVAGLDPITAGLAFSPLGAAVLCGSPLAGRLMHRFRWPVIVAFSQTCCAAALCALATAAFGRSLIGVILALVVLGAASTTSVVCLNVAAGRNVVGGDKGAAYGAYETSKYLSTAVVIAGLATVVTAHGAAPTDLAAGFRLAFLLSAALALTGGLAAYAFAGRRHRTHDHTLEIPTR